MGNRWRVPVMAVFVVAASIAGIGRARASDDGLVLRAFGFYEGTFEDGKCQVPGIASGFLDPGNEMGLWNTYGYQTISFPDLGNPWARPCGVFLQVQNNMFTQGINVERVDLRLRIAGAKQFRQFVPTRNGFPSACSALRKARVFTGMRLGPVVSDPANGNSGSGSPHVAFAQLLPLVSSQVIGCLRDQYAGLPSSVYTSFPLVIRAVVSGVADNGSSYKSNAVSYPLTLRHLCGNGRVDDGELCDPNGPNSCTEDKCDTSRSVCKLSGRPCAGDSDCAGVCIAQDDPSECTCVY